MVYKKTDLSPWSVNFGAFRVASLCLLQKQGMVAPHKQYHIFNKGLNLWVQIFCNPLTTTLFAMLSNIKLLKYSPDSQLKGVRQGLATAIYTNHRTRPTDS